VRSAARLVCCRGRAAAVALPLEGACGVLSSCWRVVVTVRGSRDGRCWRRWGCPMRWRSRDRCMCAPPAVLAVLLACPRIVRIACISVTPVTRLRVAAGCLLFLQRLKRGDCNSCGPKRGRQPGAERPGAARAGVRRGDGAARAPARARRGVGAQQRARDRRAHLLSAHAVRRHARQGAPPRPCTGCLPAHGVLAGASGRGIVAARGSCMTQSVPSTPTWAQAACAWQNIVCADVWFSRTLTP